MRVKESPFLRIRGEPHAPSPCFFDPTSKPRPSERSAAEILYRPREARQIAVAWGAPTCSALLARVCFVPGDILAALGLAGKRPCSVAAGDIFLTVNPCADPPRRSIS